MPANIGLSLAAIGEGGLAAVPSTAGFLNPYAGANACMFPLELQGILFYLAAGQTVVFGLGSSPSGATPATLVTAANPAGAQPMAYPVFFKNGACPYISSVTGTPAFQWL